MNKIDWNQSYNNNAKFTPVSEIVLDKLKLRGKQALDIGCGTGDLLRQLAARGFDITGVDLSSVAIEKAKEQPGTFIAGDFMDADLSGSYDVIFINKVLAFVDDKKAFLNKARSLLSPEGKIVIITPVLHEEYKSKYSQRLKNISIGIAELKKLLPAGWSEVDLRYFDDYGHELTLELYK